MLLRNPFRLDRGTIGTRLTACFVAIVLSMIAADAIAMWQFRRASAPARRLTQADQNSLSVARVHLDVDTFRDDLAELASTHDIRQFTTKATLLERNSAKILRKPSNCSDHRWRRGRTPPSRAHSKRCG